MVAIVRRSTAVVCPTLSPAMTDAVVVYATASYRQTSEEVSIASKIDP